MTDAALHLNTPDSTDFRLSANFRKAKPVSARPLTQQYEAAITEMLGFRQPHATRRRVDLALTSTEHARTEQLRGLDELRRTHSAADVDQIMRRIAPTRAEVEQFIRAESLIGSLYGPERQAVWMTTELSALGRTPLEYLGTVGPRGWTQVLFILEGLMQGGSDSSQADRDWATERLAGHKLKIRR